MQHVEAAADEAAQVEPVGEPRREAEHAFDTGRVGGERGNGAAHREAHEQRPRRAPTSATAARTSSSQRSSRFHDLIR